MPRVRAVPEVKNYTPDEIRDKLDEYGVTAYRFAKLVGITPPGIYSILAGKRRQSALVRVRFAQGLDGLGQGKRAQHVPEGAEPRVRAL